MITWELFSNVCGRVAVDFYVKMLPAVLMFCLPCKKRARFGRRICFAILFSLLYSILLTFLYLHSPRVVIVVGLYSLYLFLMIGIFLLELYLYRSSAIVLLINLLGGFALDQICLFIFYIFYYQIPGLRSISNVSFEYYGIKLLWFITAYALSYFTFIRRQNASFDDSIDGKRITLLVSIGMSLFLIAFNLVRTTYTEQASIMDYMCLICLILFYILILFFRGGLLKNYESEKELLLTKRVWEEKEKSLKLTQEAVNTINIKYHDLKHMTRAIKRGEDPIGLAADITDSLKGFENTVSTGNETLDMILTEQLLKYNQHGIEFSCIADGSAISFMSSLDIISLFSNALDNAFEAVASLEKEKREIHLDVKETMGMVYICVENPFGSQITMQNGLPVTIKDDKNYHGFGMKSIRSTVDKYGGNVQILTDNGRFKLKILIPEK